MAPSIDNSVSALVSSFVTTQLASTSSPTSTDKITISDSILGMYAEQKDFNYDVKSSLGKVHDKTKAITTKFIATEDDLINLIKTRYAYLLVPTETGYTIDLSDLNKLKMRDRYRSIGCVIKLNKALDDVSVEGIADIPETKLKDKKVKALDPSAVIQIAMLALSLYTILKNVVVGIYSAITSNLTLATRIQMASEAAVTGASQISSQATAIQSAVASITASQKTLYPFQHGTPQFIDRVLKLLLSKQGLLYHIGAVDHDSLLQYIQDAKASIQYQLPKPVDDQVGTLPIVKIGQEYWNHIKVFVQDVTNKGLLVDSEVDKLLDGFKFPKEWSKVDAITYVLWHQMFSHRLYTQSAYDTWSKNGSYFTWYGETLHAGIASVIESFKKFFQISSTRLTSCSDVVATPALARKFISLSMEMKNSPVYSQYQFINPENVSISLV